MARVYHESFDAVGTSNSYLASKWSALGGAFQSTISGTIQAGSARTGTNGFRPIVASNMYLAAQTEFYVGFAIRFTFLPTSYFWVDGETTATEGHVRLVTSGGKIQAQIATTPYAVLGTGSRTLIVNNWYYVEIRHLVNQTTGRVVVKVDGVTEIDFTGDTQGVPANGNIALIQWLLGTAGTDFDDIYINDTTGSESNGFDGDQRIYAVFADGAGNYAQWDPSAGANWQNVDDNPPDDDTTYNDTPVANEKDSFTFADVAPSPALTSISAVQAMYYARRADASAATFRRDRKSVV